MALLSLCMPSNRSFARSYSSIETALIFAEKYGCRLIVSDNSEDSEKRDYWIDRSTHLIYLTPGACDVDSNVRNTLTHVDTPFLMMLGDDDEIFLRDDVMPIDLARLPANVVGVRPQTFLWTVPDGIRQSESFEILSEGSEGRFREYNVKAMGNNTIYYSIIRSNALRDILNIFTKHPAQGGYIDWAIVFTLLAVGKMVFDPAILFRYDWERWSTVEGIEQANKSLFTAAGLTNVDDVFEPLLRFMDIHCFLQLASLEISPADREAALNANSRMCFCAFAQRMEQKLDLMTNPMAPIILAVTHMPDADVAFDVACDFLDACDLGKARLGSDYRTYLERVQEA
ncbi:hypothetical protein BJF93_06500 [Xaviernesmea oryzae]|uniref:Glycosyltransferase n=1 Tax=Xaviernesmea oryzae TaxID=464029 RepID=A0A1Q9AS48_9HYPH|nr:hypothetical protein [Xaviernesmea oryzae]OLP58262.1 hypothetical protein BJF93_06500 [Xaviernesmea oryzae]SEL44463.1 hypothetical protein SAMN04487976_108112 [Xaviernesmea oryzae]